MSMGYHSKSRTIPLFSQKYLQQDTKQKNARIHSLNSLLKDQTYNSQGYPPSYSQGIRTIARAGTNFFGPWIHNSKKGRDDTRDEETPRSWLRGRLSFFDDDLQESPLHTYPKKKEHEILLDKKCRTKLAANSSNNIGNQVHQDKTNTQDHKPFQRIVIMKGLPLNAELGSIVSRVCGGPLERIILKQAGAVELYFMFPLDAGNFLKYGNSGLLKYNGVKPMLEWANETNTENITSIHSPMKTKLTNKVIKGARRTLLFLKEVSNKPKIKSKKMFFPNQALNYSEEFNIKNVLADFAPLGNIIDFKPVISTTLAFSLSFDDVRSAITIKNQCESQGTRLHSKYGEWSIYFAKDITDKPCVQV